MKNLILGIIFAIIIFTGLQSTIPYRIWADNICDIDDTRMSEILLKDLVVQKFLQNFPSATHEHYKIDDLTFDADGESLFYYNGMSLSVFVIQDNSDNCISIVSYSVGYDMPSQYGAISLQRSSYFESDKVKDAIHTVNDLTNPQKQMKMGIPLYEIKCREGLYSTFKIDRVTPACVTEKTWNELLVRGWSPLRMGSPGDINILITYNATMLYPYKITKEFDSRSCCDVVFWVNNDITTHSLIAEDQSWSIESIKSGEVRNMFFNQTGIYKYYIKEKPDVTGIIDFSHPIELDAK